MTHRFRARFSSTLMLAMLIVGAMVPAASAQTLGPPDGNYDPTEFPENCWPDFFDPEMYSCRWFLLTESKIYSEITQEMSCTLGRSPREAVQSVTIVTTEYITYYRGDMVTFDGESWGYSVLMTYTERMFVDEWEYGRCKPVAGAPHA